MVLLLNRKLLPLSLPDLTLFLDTGIPSHGGFLVAMFFLLEVAQYCNLFVQLAIKPVQVAVGPGLFSWLVAVCIRHPMKEGQQASVVGLVREKRWAGVPSAGKRTPNMVKDELKT
jgi:hypothetical protein